MRQFIVGSATAVLIGGPADGRRVTMADPSNPLPYLRVEVPIGGSLAGPINAIAEYKIVEYRAERVREGDYEYTVYVYEEGPFLGKLLAGYKREED